jgi:hypothetical protein
MIPELRLFCLSHHRDFSLFQNAQEEFWRSFRSDFPTVFWTRLREGILEATPDSEEFESLVASFALNAALVAAEIAGFKEDEKNSHIIDALGYARDSLDAQAAADMTSTIALGQIRSDDIQVHPLVIQEQRTEEADLELLSALEDAPWSEDMIAALRRRSTSQGALL